VDIIKYVVRWDRSTGAFEEYIVASGIGLDFAIEKGGAYYLYSTSPYDVEFAIVGDCPENETFDLFECWNLMGYQSMEIVDVGVWADMIDAYAGEPVVQAIVKYNDDFGQGENEYISWYPGLDDDLFQVRPGGAYWIFVSTDVWDVRYPHD